MSQTPESAYQTHAFSARELLHARARLAIEVAAIESLREGYTYIWPERLESAVMITRSDERYLVYDEWTRCKPGAESDAVRAALAAEQLAAAIRRK
jgi:hypothetical protein